MKFNLFFGLFWLASAIIQILISEKIKEIHYYWFVISGIYLAVYFYQNREKYLTIENGIITQNWPFGKKMNLNEIKQIRHFAGEYILKSESQKMTINIQLIEKNSLSDLKAELEKLSVEWN